MTQLWCNCSLCHLSNFFLRFSCLTFLHTNFYSILYFNNKLKKNKTLELDLIFFLLSVSIYFFLQLYSLLIYALHNFAFFCIYLRRIWYFYTCLCVVFLYFFICIFMRPSSLSDSYGDGAKKYYFILFKKKLSLQFPWLFSTNFATISGYAMRQICHRYVKSL